MKKIKRLLAVVSVAALLCALFPSAAFAAQTRYLVTAPRALLLSAPDEAAAPVGELYAGLYVTAEEENGAFVYVTLRSAGIGGWVHSRFLEYAGDGQENPTHIKSIYIKTEPEKLVYEEDIAQPDLSGLSVWASFADGSADREISGWDVYYPSLDSEGKKTVTVLYRAAPGAAVFTASFQIIVNKTPLLALVALSQPEKTDYIERQPLDLTGLRLQAFYTDDRPPRIFTAEEILSDPDFTLTGCHGETPGELLQAGDHTLTVSYKEPAFSVALPFTVKPRTVTNLTISKQPDSTVVYSRTEVPKLEGLELTADYDNGETETVPASLCTVDCDPSRFVLGGGNLVTVSYGGKSVTLRLTLAQEELTGIHVITPEILAFILGEPMDLSDLKVYKLYASGRREETTDYTVSGLNKTQTGAQTVTILCGEFSETFTVYIQEFYQRGDVDGDGRHTAMDARLILRAAVGYINYQSEKLRSAADVDRDGNISAADARLALRAAVGLEDLLQG